MSIILAGCALVFFTILGFWRPNPIPFMLAAGVAAGLGFQWFDTYTNNMGLVMSLALIGYSFACIGYAFRMIFWSDRLRDE